MKLRDEQNVLQRVDILAEALETVFERTFFEIVTDNGERCLHFEDRLGDGSVSIRHIAEQLEVLLS